MLVKNAPIALFVYNRPAHTRRTVEALALNINADTSVLHVFSDAPKSDSDISTVKDVRKYIKKITGFKLVIITERTENYGLAKSIISGVTELCNEYGRVIVLEDDDETSPHFLNFMNDSLAFYDDKNEVMHISGCRYPAKQVNHDHTFFLHVPLCWGWATWQRAWKMFEKDISVMQKFDRKMINHFDFDNTYNYWQQLEFNKSGKLNTWFVFWYATLFLRGGLALFPARSLVQNIGMDGSGTNSGSSKSFDVELNPNPVKLKNIPCVESQVEYEFHKQYFRKLKVSIFQRIIRKFFRLVGW